VAGRRTPNWLTEARKAERQGARGRALDLLANYATRRATLPEDRDRAAKLAFQIATTGSTKERTRAAEIVARLTGSRRLPAPLAERMEALRSRMDDFLAAGLPRARAEALSSLPAGPYAVILFGFGKGYDPEKIGAALQPLGYTAREMPRLLERVEHIAPETVAFDLDQSAAVAAKRRLEEGGGRVRIEEQVRRETGERRPSISEAVRHEVWRRDGGRCVDCGSRENLHFDHIVPWSRGGSNTVRNLELRCEKCNLKKGAKI
jgi:HNH endonuclease